MLAADTNVELGINGLAELDSHFHELADTCLIELSEGIVLEDLGFILSVEELAGVVT